MSTIRKVTIFDYGAGNIFSISHALEHLGVEVLVTSDPLKINEAEALVLPGVGAFAQAMNKLTELDALIPLKNYLKNDRKFLGICLGFQLLFESSSEFGESQGLGFFSGTIEKLEVSSTEGNKIKVPHIGWEKVLPVSEEGQVVSSISSNDNFFYFVHSFYSVPKNEEIIASYSFYEGFRFCSAVESGNIFACQFHPEKSGETGLKLLKKWLKL